MIRGLSIILLGSLLLVVSCSKAKKNIIANEPSLEGNWKMVLYVDSAQDVTETKEQSYSHFNTYTGIDPYPPAGDVIMKISFTNATRDSGLIQGNTIFNGFNGNFSITDQNYFSYFGGTWTLSADPPWGMYFYNGIMSANFYSFDDQSRLRLHSPSKTLVFLRE